MPSPYTSKKTGITKRYKYSHKSTRGKTLVGKGGRINKKNVEATHKAIENSNELTTVEKRAAHKELDAYVKVRHNQGKKLTTNGLRAMTMSDDESFYEYADGYKYAKMFANAGYSPEEAAAQIGVDSEALLNPANWNGEVFTDPVTGQRHTYKHNYTESLWS